MNQSKLFCYFHIQLPGFVLISKKNRGSLVLNGRKTLAKSSQFTNGKQDKNEAKRG